MSVKLLTEQCLELQSLRGGCTGSFEYIHVKMPHCWKSHDAAYMFVQVTLSLLVATSVAADNL